MTQSNERWEVGKGKVQLGPDSPLHNLGKKIIRRGRPEDDHTRNFVIPLYDTAGFAVNVTSARRHAKGVTAGIPDLYLQHATRPIRVWHEAKWTTRQSLAQHFFMMRELAVGNAFYVLGQAEDAGEFLLWMGFASSQLGARREVHGTPTEWHNSAIFQKQLVRWGYRSSKQRKRTLVSR